MPETEIPPGDIYFSCKKMDCRERQSIRYLLLLFSGRGALSGVTSALHGAAATAAAAGTAFFSVLYHALYYQGNYCG